MTVGNSVESPQWTASSEDEVGETPFCTLLEVKFAVAKLQNRTSGPAGHK
jgi:hypothetical protein